MIGGGLSDPLDGDDPSEPVGDAVPVLICTPRRPRTGIVDATLPPVIFCSRRPSTRCRTVVAALGSSSEVHDGAWLRSVDVEKPVASDSHAESVAVCASELQQPVLPLPVVAVESVEAVAHDR